MSDRPGERTSPGLLGSGFDLVVVGLAGGCLLGGAVVWATTALAGLLGSGQAVTLPLTGLPGRWWAWPPISPIRRPVIRPRLGASRRRRRGGGCRLWWSRAASSGSSSSPPSASGASPARSPAPDGAPPGPREATCAPFG